MELESSNIPLLAEEGWMRGQSNAAKPPFSAQTGWSVGREPSISAGLTTPSAPLEEASRHFICVAATPPLGGGESA
jgi:hypothetical protein